MLSSIKLSRFGPEIRFRILMMAAMAQLLRLLYFKFLASPPHFASMKMELEAEFNSLIGKLDHEANKEL